MEPINMSETRECESCHHIGTDDDDDHVATCHYCGETQHINCDDYCPSCNKQGHMGASCPECKGIYSLIIESEQ